jgi:uncharacterized protein
MRKLTAIFCLTIAVLLGSVVVSWSADFQKGLTAYNSGDYATAVSEFRPLAEQENADAQYYLGLMYRSGDGTPPEWDCDSGKLLQNEECRRWFTYFSSAAKNGHAKSQIIIAELMLYKGPLYLGWEDATAEDCDLAENYLLKASKEEYAEANFILGMYGCGFNENERFNLIKNSVDEGFDEAFIPVAERYNRGLGTSVNKIRAYMFYTIAFESGKWKDLRSDVSDISSFERRKAQKLARECVRKKYKGC